MFKHKKKVFLLVCLMLTVGLSGATNTTNKDNGSKSFFEVDELGIADFEQEFDFKQFFSGFTRDNQNQSNSSHGFFEISLDGINSLFSSIFDYNEFFDNNFSDDGFNFNSNENHSLDVYLENKSFNKKESEKDYTTLKTSKNISNQSKLNISLKENILGISYTYGASDGVYAIDREVNSENNELKIIFNLQKKNKTNTGALLESNFVKKLESGSYQVSIEVNKRGKTVHRTQKQVSVPSNYTYIAELESKKAVKTSFVFVQD